MVMSELHLWVFRHKSQHAVRCLMGSFNYDLNRRGAEDTEEEGGVAISNFIDLIHEVRLIKCQPAVLQE